MHSAARAYQLAPQRILAYNSWLERHHLGLNLPSLLFWRGVPIARIYLRLRWWPWPKRERSVVLEGHWVLEDGRAPTNIVGSRSSRRTFPTRLRKAVPCASTTSFAKGPRSLMWSCSRFRIRLCRPRPLRSWSSAPV